MSENAELRILVDYLQRQRFRKSSEAYTGMQSLFADGKAVDSAVPEAEPISPNKPRTSNGGKPVRNALPSDMPREVIRHELPADQRQCAL